MALGLFYAVSHLLAIHDMNHVVFGGVMPRVQMLSEANRSVAWYPFDPYLRSLRQYVVKRLGQSDAMDSGKLRQEAQ